MKIRTGFVSNSSSSSFVLKVGNPFKTALEVAEHMIPFREWETDQTLLNKIKNLKYSRQTDLNAVCFKSCNYDTFIAKMGEVFLVETCHNHDWDLGKWRAPCPAEFYEYFGDDSFYNLSHCIDFLHLEYNVVGRPVDWRDGKDFDYQCPNGHYDAYWRIGESIKCPCCGASPVKKVVKE